LRNKVVKHRDSVVDLIHHSPPLASVQLPKQPGASS
jgi:hypothetical protein